MINDGAVQSADPSNGAVTSSEIASGAVTTGKLSASGSTSGQILASNGSGVAWRDAPAGGSGDITGVSAGSGLTGGGTCAEAHRIPVEEVKPGAEQGSDLHPGLFAQPEELGTQ